MSISILIGSIENQDHWVYGLILKTIMCVKQYLSLSITISLGFIICYVLFVLVFCLFVLFVFVYCCSFCRGDRTEAYS